MPSNECDAPLPLDRAGRIGTVGRKAATLARLRLAGFPVPDGFVIPAAATALDDRTIDAVLTAAKALGGPFAVRSSGVDEDGEHASHAGQYTTVLGVEGDAALLESIGRCAASARSAQVRAYRAAHGLPPDAPLAVLVQRLVPAEMAGVAVTADPVTGDRAQTVVSAVRGFGDRLVDGAATPDEWMVCDGAVHRRSAGEDAIDADSARSVAELARRVEAHEGAPQDIEWAIAGGELFLLQARPMTGFPAAAPVPVEIDPPPGYWTREASHAPQPWTPFTRSLLSGRNNAFRHMMAEFGFLLDGVVVQDIGGWEYMRLVPLGGKDRRRPPDWLVPLLVRAVPAMRARIRDCVAATRSDTAGRLIRRWHDHWLDELAGRIARLRDADLAALPDSALDRHFGEARALYDDGCLIHMRLHGAIGLLLGELVFACQDLLGWDDDRSLSLLSGLSTRSTEPARRLAELAALARTRPSVRRVLERPGAVPGGLPRGTDPEFARAFARYRRDHGCRALRYEAADPTVDEVPGLILDLVRDQLASGYDPQAEAAVLAAGRASAAAEALRLLAARPTSDRERFQRALVRAELAYPVREDNAYYTTSAPTALVRVAALEVGRRLADRGQIAHRDDVFQLDPDEMRAALRSGEAQDGLVTRRKGELAWVLAHPGPASYGTDPGPPPSMAALPAEAREAMRTLFWMVDRIVAPGRSGTIEGAQLRGLAASSGSYTGPVRIIRGEAEFGRIRAGDVLVCPTTSPVWSMLFPSIGALVTDTGGVLSHPAIIAREYRVPAVVAAGQATTLLREGETVTVDGNAGTVAYVR
jgi:rifampicin phosphotransferase